MTEPLTIDAEEIRKNIREIQKISMSTSDVESLAIAKNLLFFYRDLSWRFAFSKNIQHLQFEIDDLLFGIDEKITGKTHENN